MKEALKIILNEQINAEYYSAYLYFSMSAYCTQKGFEGFANWMYVQAKEELAHGTHIFEHLLEVGIHPELAEIKAPLCNFKSLKDVFELSLAHEKNITKSINNIAALAMQEGDYTTYQFIQWYISEQVEEEASVSRILQKLTNMGDNIALLYSLDTELMSRVYTDPFVVA